MNCATYHPMSGYVYAAGTSIQSLPPLTTKTIATWLNQNSQHSQQQQQHHSQHHNNRKNKSLLSSFSSSYKPSIYFHAINVLPPPGARTGNDSIAMACNGKIVIVAAANTFYAIGGLTLPNDWTHSLPDLNTHTNHTNNSHNPNNSHNVHSNMYAQNANHSNTTNLTNQAQNPLTQHMDWNSILTDRGNAYGRSPIEKVISFAQSSQVHPTIVIELPIYSKFNFTNDNNNNNNNLNYNHKYTSLDLDDPDTSSSLLFLASGKECASIEIIHNPHISTMPSTKNDDDETGCEIVPGGTIVVKTPKHGIITLNSPILAAVGLLPSQLKRNHYHSLSSSNLNNSLTPNSHNNTTYPTPPSSFTPTTLSNHNIPLVAVLTSDGLVHTRSPSCIAVPLATVEVGPRPNDFFALQPLPGRRLLAISYSGDAKILAFRQDTPRDIADRLMKLSIDAFGTGSPSSPSLSSTSNLPNSNNNNKNNTTITTLPIPFPRNELADALGAGFSATSYVGVGPDTQSCEKLKQYLQAFLGLDRCIMSSTHDDDDDKDIDDDEEEDPFDNCTQNTTEENNNEHPYSSISRHPRTKQIYAQSHTFTEGGPPIDPVLCLTATALLCLVCTKLTPSNPSLAKRAAKLCAQKMGIVPTSRGNMNIHNNNNNIITTATSSSSSIIEKDGGAPAKVCDLVADALLRHSKDLLSASISNITISISASPSPIQKGNGRYAGRQTKEKMASASLDMVKAAAWLLRACGRHERAIMIMEDKMNDPQYYNIASSKSHNIKTNNSNSNNQVIYGWSRLKYESYMASHLGQLWAHGEEASKSLVLRSSATRHLLENNPRLGLHIFLPVHGNGNHNLHYNNHDHVRDPLMEESNPTSVVNFLKSISPIVPIDKGSSDFASSSTSTKNNLSLSNKMGENHGPDFSVDLPLSSGRALAVTFLMTATGISNKGEDAYNNQNMRDSSRMEESSGLLLSSPKNDVRSSEEELKRNEHIADQHDELAYLLLEGVLSERGDDDDDDDTIKNDPKNAHGSESKSSLNDTSDSKLGALYRAKLRRFLAWPKSKVRAERLMSSLPASFLRERALLLGRLGRHQDALRILYCDLKDLDLALEYCDVRHESNNMIKKNDNNHEQQQQQYHHYHSLNDGDDTTPHSSSCAYLPLVSVALNSDSDTERGVAAAIRVLSLRRDVIDRAAALRLLPNNVPVSAVARPFLIPSLIDAESHVRRLSVLSSLLRARYVKLRKELTNAQIQSQSKLRSVKALKALDLGCEDPVFSSKPFRVRSSHHPASSERVIASYLPHVMVVKHFFPQYMILEARVTNGGFDSNTMNNNDDNGMNNLNENYGISHTNNNTNNNKRALGDVQFLVAESSEEALLPSLTVPIKMLPTNTTGSAWCVLAASPQRLDGVARLACELRYSVLNVDATTGVPLNFGMMMGSIPEYNNFDGDYEYDYREDKGGYGGVGNGIRKYVEELQDIEVQRSEFDVLM